MATLAEMLVQNALGNQDVSKGPDIAGNLAKGAQVAQQAQQIQMQRQQLQMQMQAVHDAKLEKFAQAVEKGQQYSGKAQTNYYNDFLPNYRNSLGLQNDIPDSALKFGTLEQNLPIFNSMRSDVLRGVMTGAQTFQMWGNADQMADYVKARGLNPSPDGKLPALSQQQMDAINADEKTATENSAKVGEIHMNQGFKLGEDEQAFRTHIADKGNTEIGPLVADKVHINSAINAIQRIKDAQAAGKTPSRQDLTLAATGLATTVAKRINPTEFENIMHLPGAENWTIDKWNTYIAGGINPNVAKGLDKAIKDTAGQVDSELRGKHALIQSEVKNSRWGDKSDSILDPINKLVQSAPQPKGPARKKAAPDTLKPPPPESIFKIRGQNLPLKQLQEWAKNHPDARPLIESELTKQGLNPAQILGVGQ